MSDEAEWLESDGLGGFAMGRADGMRSRRYHSLLTVATTPPTGRFTLVNGVEAWLERDGERTALSSHRYAPGVTHPDGAARVIDFSNDPWPRWRFRIADDVVVAHEVMMARDSSFVVLSWQATTPVNARLTVRPLLSGRDMHALHHENSAFRFDGEVNGARVRWRPYEGVPEIIAISSGEYRAAPEWYRSFQYDAERERGLDFIEDLASPGVFTFDLREQRAVLAFGSGSFELGSELGSELGTELGSELGSERNDAATSERAAISVWQEVERAERGRRARFETPMHRAADAYIVRRDTGRTIVAGYPWFSDWGRDTFIALRGLCLAGERLTDARDILMEWSRHVDHGMLPNFFPDGKTEPEYNSVDASLWFVVAVHEFLARAEGSDLANAHVMNSLHLAVDRIVDGYAHGTRFGIAADASGLLRAGEPGVQLTWMDAKVDGWVVTPRVGKPVEIQALWINALRIAGQRSARWTTMANAATDAFHQRFWNHETQLLYDVVDVDHVPGKVDASFRPNQLFAVGGLPWALVDGERARRIIDAAERSLWTPAGPRSLAPSDSAYQGHYGGDRVSRDGAYHQGTVWPWLAGAFIEGWVRVHGNDDRARETARSRFLDPMLRHYGADVRGQLAEIADGDAPNAPKGSPFQAWSVGEALRLVQVVLRVSHSEKEQPVSSKDGG